MASNIVQDKYILGQSVDGSIDNVAGEIRIDLQLQPNTNNLTGGKVSGTVVDSNGNPIPNALVKLMDSDYTPLMHTITDSNGTYSLNNIMPNKTYNIFAVASGMITNQENEFTISSLQHLTINFAMEEDPAMSLCVVAGDLVNQTTNKPVSGAVVSLYLVNSDNTETLEAITYTNEYGQYTFREIPMGNYVVKINALGYISTKSNISLIYHGQLLPMIVNIVPNPHTSRGTVSGIITNENNQPINRADVILYKVNTNSSLTPLSFTKTNSNGIYLFANVAPGDYKIKSNQSEVIDINIPVPVKYSPDFNYFMISNFSTLATNAVDGILSGGAEIDYNNQMVSSINTATEPSITVPITASSTCDYTMGIQYLNGDSIDRSFKIDVNGIDTGITYTPPLTSGWNLNDADMFNVQVPLIEGANTVKLYNVSTGDAIPSIGSMYFAPVTNFSAINGTLSDGAMIPSNPYFVAGIGDNGGILTITPDAPISGEYTLGIQHLNGDAERPLMIDVNGVSTGITYDIPKTSSWNIQDAAVYNITVNLSAGVNTLKFYNSPNATAPWIGTITLTPIFQMNYYDATKAELSGSATINNGFVTGMKSGDGTIALNVQVPSKGTYNLGMGYVADDNTKQCNISVNGTSTNITYTFNQTTGITPDSVVYKIAQLILDSGANTIEIYNK